MEVETADGSYEAKSLVLAPGARTPELLEDLGIPLQAYRLIMHWFTLEGGVGPFEPGRYPVVIWEPDDGNILYSIPAHEGEGGGVKAAFHHANERPCTLRTLAWEISKEETAAIRAYLRGRIPTLAGSCVRAACISTNNPDLQFVLSAHPRHPQEAVACGFSGHGYKFASVMGEILADLATEGGTRHPIDLVSPTRHFEPDGG